MAPNFAEQLQLPFFQDEFILRATNSNIWDEIVHVQTMFESSNNEEDSISRFLELLNDPALIIILSRRFSRFLRTLHSDRGSAAFLALQACLTQALDDTDEEDKTSLDRLETLDFERRTFIQAGKWKDTSMSFEHYLEVEVLNATARARRNRKQVCVELVLMVPILVLLPLILFILLLSLPKINPIALAVLFGLEALGLGVIPYHRLGLVGARVMAGELALMVSFFSCILLERNSSVGFALMQLFVSACGCSVLMDLRQFRKWEE